MASSLDNNVGFFQDGSRMEFDPYLRQPRFDQSYYCYDQPRYDRSYYCYDRSYGGGGGAEYTTAATAAAAMAYPSRPPEKLVTSAAPTWWGDGQKVAAPPGGDRDGLLLQWYCYCLGINPALCYQLPEAVAEEILKQALLSSLATSTMTTTAAAAMTDCGSAPVSAMAMMQQQQEVLPDPVLGPPHEAFRYVVHYLGLKELLCLEMVSKFLLEVVRSESPAWQNLKVDHPLDLKLTDTALMSLALRSQGRLQSLKLANCQRISDASLEMVLAGNTMLTNLDVSACKGLTIQAVVKMVQRHTLPGYKRIRRLRVEGINDITKEHIQELRDSLCPDRFWPPYYRLLHSGYGDRVLDVEACPKCGLLRAVYDCWRKKCCEKWSDCRGCLSCVKRCDNCGGCFENGDYEETFALENMCLKCCSKEPMEAKFPGTGFGCGSESFQEQKIEGEKWRRRQQQQEAEAAEKQAAAAAAEVEVTRKSKTIKNNYRYNNVNTNNNINANKINANIINSNNINNNYKQHQQRFDSFVGARQ